MTVSITPDRAHEYRSVARPRIHWPGQDLGLPSPQLRHDPISALGFRPYHAPVLAMLVQGSAGGSAPPACSSSIEMPSGVRMKAMRPSRGGRLIVTPRAMKALQVS